MEISYIFSKMFILFSILIIGYVSNKVGFIDEVGNKKLSSIVLNLALPLKMLSSLNEATCTKQDIVLVSAMPCAATTVMFAQQYDFQEDYAAKHVFITTLLAVLTIPIVGYILYL